MTHARKHERETRVTNTESAVRDVLVTILGMEDRAHLINSETKLLDELPELDSMAVVELMVALEERFSIRIEEGDLRGEVFQTLASLSGFVDEHLSAAEA